jgi:tellurite resistance protein
MAAKKKKPAAKTKKKAPARKAPAKKRSSKSVAGRATAAKSSKKKAVKRAPAKTSNGASDEVAETILQAVTITVIADGDFASEEEALLRRLAAEPLFHRVKNVTQVVKSAVDRCIKDGLDAALAALAKRLPSAAERETAFATCLAAAAADGKITSTEARLLQTLKSAFQISDQRVRALAGPISEIFD